MTLDVNSSGRAGFSQWLEWPAWLQHCTAKTVVSMTTEDKIPAIDEKQMDSCYKWLDRVVRLCEHPRLNLTVSQPYLLDIIPDTFEKLQAIVQAYQSDFAALSEIEYFCIFVHSIIQLSRHTVRLFNQAKETIFNPQSSTREYLPTLGLVFSHLLLDLKALFPDRNRFASASFRITKPDAAKWWKDNFGSKSIVRWTQFEAALRATFITDSDIQLPLALRSTVDLTCNGHVSIFEFDVFTRLFQPWATILHQWKALVLAHPGYMAFMTYDQVRSMLKQFRAHPGPGTFVFRLSCTKLGQWVIGFVDRDRKILQTIIQNKSIVQALVDGERDGFYLYPNGQSNPSQMIHRLHQQASQQQHLQVTMEQYQLYCQIGSAFELCKICDENSKNVRLEPCGHLLCKSCFVGCQSNWLSQSCPFCRLEIKGFEDVIVEPYKPHPSIPKTTTTLGSSLKAKESVDSLEMTLSENVLPRKPPPVPPRCPVPTLSPDYESGCEAVVGDECLLICYPNLMGSVDKPGHIMRSLSSNGDTTPPSPVLDSQPPTAARANGRLHYAQLELSTCDSDPEMMELCSSKQLDSAGQAWSVQSGSLDLPYPSNQQEQVPDRCRPEVPITPPPDSMEMAESLVQRLQSAHPDMRRTDAELLLQITNNELDMIAKIWQHFMPRTHWSAS